MIRHRLFPLAPFLFLVLAAASPLSASTVVGTGTPFIDGFETGGTQRWSLTLGDQP